MKTAYTDYPFEFLGDEPYKKAPIRKIMVIGPAAKIFDKYIDIIVEGQETRIKAGYIYEKPGRLGEVPRLFPRTHAGKFYD